MLNMENVARENRNLWGILHNANTVIYDHYFGGIAYSRPLVVIQFETKHITVKLNRVREFELNGEYLLGLVYTGGEYLIELYTGYDKVDDPYDGGKYIGRVTEVLKWD